ncbi:MAG: SspB family protein [Roseiarcus sp.]
MATDLIRYDLLVQDALRSVVRKVLADTARNGLVGEHHFNIAFKTQAPGVVAPAAVKQRFPDEMSIILQHEFWDLLVTQDAFEVSLNFSRKPERLTVPFDSITGFTDPSVPFGFKLEPRVPEPAATPGPAAAEEKEATARPAPAKSAPVKPPAQPASAAKSARRAEKPERNPAEPGGEAKVVSIDAFRKK